MKNLIALFAIFAVIAAITFGIGWATGRSAGVVTVILACLAALGSLWVALFVGWFGASTSMGMDAWMKLPLMIIGHLPLVTLATGFIFGRQSA